MAPTEGKAAKQHPPPIRSQLPAKRRTKLQSRGPHFLSVPTINQIVGNVTWPPHITIPATLASKLAGPPLCCSVCALSLRWHKPINTAPACAGSVMHTHSLTKEYYLRYE